MGFLSMAAGRLVVVGVGEKGGIFRDFYDRDSTRFSIRFSTKFDAKY